MSYKRLNSYKGHLGPAQVSEGMNLARKNAIRLLEDAKILYENNRYPSATALAILSIEESGKTSILRQLSLVKPDEELKNTWKEYRSHTKKNVLWTLLDMVNKGAQQLDDFKPMFDPASEHPYVLDNIKQISFYTDCLGQAHWSNPSEIINRNLASSLIFVAEALSVGYEITTKEIELWIKHLGNADISYESQKKAVLNWYYDMENNGLLPSDYSFTDVMKWLGFNIDDISSE
ncbi:MAG: AbiV family abortive infection protein [Dehalococcoidales bacterium]|nr:MAG: AbiV family abortive infection protein [Dehalococcoidales bacterium]